MGDNNFARQVLDSDFNQNPESLSLGDLDQDGDQDVIVVGGNAAIGEVIFFENDGNGQFAKRIIDDSQGNRRHFSLADFDADEDLDVIVPNNFPFEIDLYLNEGRTTLTSETENAFVFNLRCFPNPSQKETNLSFVLRKSTYVSLQIYDLSGLIVATLVQEELLPGSYDFSWDRGEKKGGVYLYKFQVGSFVSAQKLILLE
jgi:hypothetical protein